MTTHSVTVALMVAGCIAAIGAIDYLTGPDFGLALFYLLAIVWGAWRLEPRTSLGLAALAALFWFTAASASRGVGLILVWDGLTRLGIFGGMAALVGRVRRDQQQLRELNERLKALLAEEQQLARTDALTGLPNRRLLVDELRRAIKRSRRLRVPISVAFLDLEHLEGLNQRLGHAAGDGVLRRVGEVLAQQLRESDVAARIGGDEFAVLLDGCTEASAQVTIARLSEQIQRALADASGGTVGVSIGVACFDAAPETPEMMLDHADAAMYCAKGKGPNQIYVVHYPAAPAGEAAGGPALGAGV